MIKIIVSTKEEKQELLDASRYVHDMYNIDTDIPMINTLAHLYLAPNMIEVEDDS